MLNGKRVLFIAPKFFGYEAVIVSELKSLGAIVDYFSDRPGEDFFTKSIIRLNRKLISFKTRRYYEKILNDCSDKEYDYVFFVRGEAISSGMLDKYKKRYINARFVLYLWDSMQYNPNAKKIIPKFDRVFSFDRADVDEQSKLEFLPLFYNREFDKICLRPKRYEYDACFIGTVHTDRYKVLEMVILELERMGKKVFVYCYYPSRILYFLRSIVDPGFKKFTKNYIHFRGMSFSELVGGIEKSYSVIDVNRPGQRGLTMRSIEAVGAQRKLITTNMDIKGYDLYSPSSVLVLDRLCPNVPDDFFSQISNLPYSKEVRDRYSLSQWILQVFS